MDNSKTNATRAIAITTVLTLFVTGFEIFMAYTHYKQGMNFIDIASYVTSNRYFYYLILIAANMILLPGAVLLFRENGISLKDEIFENTAVNESIISQVVCDQDLIVKIFEIKVINHNEPDTTSYWGRTTHGFWVLYKDTDNKFLWRRHNGTEYLYPCYPLNMRGRKFEGEVIKHRNIKTGRLEYSGYRPYNIEMSKFNTFDEALNYFINYLKRYRGIKI